MEPITFLSYGEYENAANNIKAAEKRMDEVKAKWEKELLRISHVFEKNGFSLKISNKTKDYVISKSFNFAPGQWMIANEIEVTEKYAIMKGIDFDYSTVGYMQIKMEDMFRDDYEEYFLNVYRNLKEKNEKEKQDRIEARERAEYERLKEKYGDCA